MNKTFYYESIDRMEGAGVQAEYIQGWIGGYMKNPMREEQRITEAYSAGYADGERGDATAYTAWQTS